MKLMGNEYTIIANTLGIHSNVNKPIDLNLIDGNFSKIIFCNYSDVNHSIEYDNKSSSDCEFHMCMNNGDSNDFASVKENEESIFNSDIIFKNSTDLIYLIFGHKFNKLVKLPDSIEKLIFGDYFNKSIKLPNSLIYLTFGDNFNKSINLPDSLEELNFGFGFNKFIKLPNSIKKLNFGDEFNQFIELPNSLNYLTFGEYFNKSIKLPNSLISVIFGHKFNKSVELPDSLIQLTFGDDFDKPIEIPDKLEFLFLGINFSHRLDFKNVKNLTISNNCPAIKNIPNTVEKIFLKVTNANVIINNLPNVKYLDIEIICSLDVNVGIGMGLGLGLGQANPIANDDFIPINDEFIENLIANIPNSVEELKIFGHFDSCINNLPSNVKKLSINSSVLSSKYPHSLDNLPDSIEHLELPFFYDEQITNFSKNLKKITCHSAYKFINDLPSIYQISTYQDEENF